MMKMNKKQFFGAMGLGLAVGAAASLAMSPKSRMMKRSSAGKAIRAVSQVMEQVAGAMGG